jgi:dephospho-CoA kinase
MLRVGLTGGIGAGKSTVAGRLAEHGAVVIDADALAREVVAVGTEGLAEIVTEFGAGVLAADGSLDRPALAARAFADDEARCRLNAIVHPRVGRRTAGLMAATPSDAVVVHDVPLLVENGLAPGYHLVVVVDAPVETRVRRLVTRGLDEAGARARIAAQATEKQRRVEADVWLDNGGAQDIVLSEVDALWADRLVPYEANVRLRRERAPMAPKISPPDPQWPAQACRALARIRLAAGDRAVRVDHIGSTAVPGLPAKDIVDLQLTVRTLADADALTEPLADAGFPPAAGEWFDDAQDGSGIRPKRFHFGGDPGRPANLHVRSLETDAWRLALLFRDWLRADPAEVDAYAEVKTRLATSHADDHTYQAYAEEKQEWVDAGFRRAAAWATRTGWTP